MMEIRDLEAGYGRIRVLNGVSLRIAEGECLGILGHNGMGKTTLLRAIMGLLPATAGSIRFADAEITHWPAHLRARRGIGYVPQGRQIFPQLSVIENIRFGALAKGGAELDRILAEIGEEFPELTRLATRIGSTLSGGEQQLLAIARALAGRPKLLLLDEPTEGIQPSIVQAIMARLSELRRARGLAVLLVEQNLDFIHGLADRAALIHRGRIVRELSREELNDPSLMEEFIGAGG
ncbi:MAG: ABC transporter ATP-binding protein [Acetobacteraceae bacterium]|nr:ABC transporter ATP-binding protein [Acetobacteraceae bacterium]